MIDTHCHIDLYENPRLLICECERAGITVLSMTNLPSHFEMGIQFFKSPKKIRLALGMHPLYSEKHDREFDIFLRNIDKTSYVGEIGLDFSEAGYKTKFQQIKTFTKILEAVSNQNKILSLHSRGAEKEVLDLLLKNNIQNSIFHWYSGPISLIKDIVNGGYYFSINPSMILSKKGQNVVSRIPFDRILTESDGPFVKVGNRTILPKDVGKVTEYISKQNDVSYDKVEKQIQNNFNELIKRIK